MSYRNSMGMMYATAGMGAAAEPGKGTPIMSSGANTAPKNPHSVRDVQRALAARGFDPGAIDGVWGTRTAAAMQRALGEVALSVSGDKRTVYILAHDWRRLTQLPAVMTPDTSPVATEPDGTPSIAGEDTDYLPWVLGAGGLLAVGGYFMWKGKKKVAANRRRRRRRRSRR